MKILDIIVPHDALDEGRGKDALDVASKAGTKIRNVANDVGERYNIKWLRRPESQGVSEHIDQMLTKAGKDLKRSPELADAERVLLDLEKTIKLDRAAKKQFEEIGDTLADLLYARKEASLGGKNPIEKLRDLYGSQPNPPEWMKNSSLHYKEINQEYCDWLTKSVNAKVTARNEVDLAKPAPPKEKTKAEKEKEEVEKKELKNRKTAADIEEQRLNKIVIENKRAENAFAGIFLRNMSDEIFLLGEGGKIYLQFQRSNKYINEWEASGVLPDDVAKLFPPVPPDLKEGSHVTGGDNNDPRIYVNEQQRVKQAANWAKVKLYKQVLFQVFGGGGAFIVGHYALKAGGGTFGSARKLAMASKILERMSEKASSITTPLIKVLAGVSRTGKYLFADYFLSAVNGGQVNSKDAASIIASMGLTYQDLTISHTADINKAVASLFLADTFKSLESMQKCEFTQQVLGAWEAAKIPFKVVADPFETLGAWIWKYFKIPDIDVVPPAEGEVPGVGEPVKQLTGQELPKPPAPGAGGPPAPVNPQVTVSSPPPPEANTDDGKTSTDTNKIRRAKLDETLKYKVLSRMKS